MPTLYVYLDESGDFNFSPSGSRFYSYAIAWTHEPAPVANSINGLLRTLSEAGMELPGFHASEDKQVHRNLFIETITGFSNWKFAALVIEKCKVNPSIRAPERFYPKFLTSMVRFVFRSGVGQRATSVQAFSDALPLARRRHAAVTKAIKESCRAELGRGVPFEVTHEKRKENAWIQVADYCTWAVFRKWESGDRRAYDQIVCRLEKPELDALAQGTTRYYSN